METTITILKQHAPMALMLLAAVIYLQNDLGGGRTFLDAAGAAVAAAAEKILQFCPQLRMRICVQGRRPRVGVQHAIDDFGDQVLRRVQHILITRPARAFLRRHFRRPGHILFTWLGGRCPVKGRYRVGRPMQGRRR